METERSNVPPGDCTPLVEMERVAVASARDPARVMIEEVDWTARAGDYWVIGGLPGSGKSDLLSTAAGLVKPARGTQRTFGRDLATLPADERVRERLRIGMVFANEGRLFNQLTVAENLALPYCYHHNCSPDGWHDRIEVLLDLMEIRGLADVAPSHIPRNQRGRVALARALALDPELLLLDDPLRGLDPRQMRWWLELLGQLRAGHARLGGRKLTLAVAVDDLRAWTEQGRQFALVEARRWIPLGGREDLRRHPEPLLRELLTDGFMDE